MKHLFDVNIAVELGINAAIVLENIGFWIKKNEANRTNYYDGYYWTYNTRKAYIELFPYFSEKQIHLVFKKLIEGEYIICGNYNQSKYDRTLWYALTDKGRKILGYDEPKTDGAEDNQKQYVAEQDNAIEVQKGNCISPDRDISIYTKGGFQNTPKGDFKIYQRGTPIPYINTDVNADVNTDNKQTPQAAMPDKSGESVTANDTLNATLKGSIASIDTSIASIKEEFEQLWAIYPNKQGKQHAYKAYERARKRKQNPVTYEQVKSGIEQYCEYIAAKGISKQYIKHGSTYFNGAEWESEYDLTPVQQYQPNTYQKPQEETKKWATAEGDHEPPEVIMGVMTIQEFAEQQPRSFAISYYEYYIGEQWAKEWADTHKEVLENARAK